MSGRIEGIVLWARQRIVHVFDAIQWFLKYGLESFMAEFCYDNEVQDCVNMLYRYHLLPIEMKGNVCSTMCRSYVNCPGVTSVMSLEYESKDQDESFPWELWRLIFGWIDSSQWRDVSLVCKMGYMMVQRLKRQYILVSESSVYKFEKFDLWDICSVPCKNSGKCRASELYRDNVENNYAHYMMYFHARPFMISNRDMVHLLFFLSHHHVSVQEIEEKCDPFFMSWSHPVTIAIFALAIQFILKKNWGYGAVYVKKFVAECFLMTLKVPYESKGM